MVSPILLLDGGLGTTLADQHACIFNDSTPLWSSHLLLSPSGQATLSAVQSGFARAGADIILTATYQASYEGFARSGVGADEAGKYMRAAVGISRSAFGSRDGTLDGGRGKVALSLGAYGAVMVPSQEYSGVYDAGHGSVEDLKEWHLSRLGAFLPASGKGEDQGVDCWKEIDLVAFETLPRLDEILAVREVMGCVSDTGAEEKEFWISCVFPGHEHRLPDGSSVKEVVAAMLGNRESARRPMGLGINCTKVGKVEGLILEFEQAVGEILNNTRRSWPSLVVYPDGTNGEVYNTTTKVWEKSEGTGGNGPSWDETIFGIVNRARKRNLWSSILVGGCCKTTPEDIGRLRQRIDELEM